MFSIKLSAVSQYTDKILKCKQVPAFHIKAINCHVKKTKLKLTVPVLWLPCNGLSLEDFTCFEGLLTIIAN